MFDAKIILSMKALFIFVIKKKLHCRGDLIHRVLIHLRMCMRLFKATDIRIK